MSYMTFLMQFVNDDSCFGDLARDARDDTRINNRWGFNKFMEHLTNMGACEAARLTALDVLGRYLRHTRGITA
jgi:hypothetical protein